MGDLGGGRFDGGGETGEKEGNEGGLKERERDADAVQKLKKGSRISYCPIIWSKEGIESGIGNEREHKGMGEGKRGVRRSER